MTSFGQWVGRRNKGHFQSEGMDEQMGMLRVPSDSEAVLIWRRQELADPPSAWIAE